MRPWGHLSEFTHTRAGWGGALLTLGVVARVPLAVAGDGLGDAEDDRATAQSDGEPATAAHEAAHTLAELELGDLLAQGVVPDDDLVRRVQGAPAAAEQEEDVRRVQGDDGGQSAPRELCTDDQDAAHSRQTGTAPRFRISVSGKVW